MQVPAKVRFLFIKMDYIRVWRAPVQSARNWQIYLLMETWLNQSTASAVAQVEGLIQSSDANGWLPVELMTVKWPPVVGLNVIT